MKIALSKDTFDLLSFIEQITHQNKDKIIFEALREYLEDLEDYKAALEAEKRLLKNPKLISIDDVMKEANINTGEI